LGSSVAVWLPRAAINGVALEKVAASAGRAINQLNARTANPNAVRISFGKYVLMRRSARLEMEVLFRTNPEFISDVIFCQFIHEWTQP
jgi:hypothetical protein